MVREIGIGEIVDVQNIIVEFGENANGYIGGYIMLDGITLTKVIFTPRELSLAIGRAAKERENFVGLKVDLGWWDKLKSVLTSFGKRHFGFGA